IVQSKKLRTAKRSLNRNTRRPDTFSEQGSRDVRSFAGALTTVQRGDDRGIKTNRGGVITAAAHRPGRWIPGITRQRKQAAARPVGSDIEAGQIGIRPFVAETCEVSIYEPRVPLRDILVFK